MIEQLFTCSCDSCGRKFQDDGKTMVTPFPTELVSAMLIDGWNEDDGRWYCPECMSERER